MNETALSIGLIIAGVLAVIMLGMIAVAWMTQKISSGWQPTRPNYPTLRPAMRHVADHFDGTLKPGPMYELPRLEFMHVGQRVQIESNWYAQQLPTATYLVSIRIDWPYPRLRLDVYPEGLLSNLQKLIGMRDIQVGDKGFDARFMISGNDLVAVERLLTSRVRELISLIRGPRLDDDVHLRIVGGEFWVSKKNLRGEPEKLLNFVQLTLALYDAMLGQPSAGIEFLDSGLTRGDCPICQVCGEGIDTPEVQCARCFTPHHRECWSYFGGCSIYGCRGKDCEPARTGNAPHVTNRRE